MLFKLIANAWMDVWRRREEVADSNQAWAKFNRDEST
jgi:hypothetical protein